MATTRLLSSLSLWFVALFLAPNPGSVQAGDPDDPHIPRLARGLVDEDGDLLADPPDDPARWIDPRRLVFAYTPVEDPSVYRDVWAGFIEHLEMTTGKSVDFFPVQSNAAQLEAMRAGRLHVAAFNTGSTPLAVNMAGFVPFCMMADEEGGFGYEMEIIVPADSPVHKVSELKGKRIAFTAPTSNSGFKAPSLLLAKEFGMEAERDFQPEFSGKHDNSIIGVANRDYDAATVANSVLQRMVGRGVVEADRIRSIYRSETFPTSSYGTVYNLHPELAAKVREAFFSFKWEGSALAREFGEQGEAKFIPADYREHWRIVREIDAAMGVKYRE